MSRHSPRIIQGLLKLHYNHVSTSKPSPLTTPLASKIDTSFTRPYTNASSNFTSFNSQIPCFTSKPTSPNPGLSQFLSCTRPNSSFSKNGSFFNGVRQFSLKGSSNLGKRVDGNFAKKLLEKPATAVTSAFSRYREALGLQIDAFLKRNSLFLIGAGGVIICALLWRLMFGIANTFVSLSEGMAKYGFLALSSAMVAFSGLYIRSRITINPDKVYRMAMTKLNTSAGILEVMGAPLTGTALRAYVMSGGGLILKNFKPTVRSKRCFLIFPILGSERKGLVSVEVKKKKGQYDMRLLAVDIPMASGPDQRLFLIGDEEEYKVGGGLISELRDPVVKAMAASKEFDVLDQIEEEEDAERELQEAERKHREEVEKLEKGGS
ncbi:IMPORT INNER MEMBRANE TRANSLOCASE SUBUNIT [Salix purpurea]|uniref:IMPORT INNER MEMBRANE TRANSLOCASE SUBUNIT n=1 Tax=Salix purpurea TaxID=77065 RepID=A0A9Q0VA08_SALPP|nr:IMPORT INNER MEMBRANE TRANSLOCASE SUBUNIT [Salix purpurea]